MAHEEMISETFKNYVTFNNNLRKKNSCHHMLNIGQLPKFSHTAGLTYFMHKYVHYICWYEDTFNRKLSTCTANRK